MKIYANNVYTEEEKEDFVGYEKDLLSSEQINITASSKRSFIDNIRANANKNFLKVTLLGMSGAIMYPLVPTIVQAISEKDMSGAKGMFMGVGLATLIGLGTGNPVLAVGSLSAMATHLLYAKGTKKIEDLTNTQIFRMNPHSVVYSNN